MQLYIKPSSKIFVFINSVLTEEAKRYLVKQSGRNCQDITKGKLWETANPHSDTMGTWGSGEATHDLVLRSSSKVIYTEEILEI